MGPPLRREEGSEYYWSITLCWGVILLALTLTHSHYSVSISKTFKSNLWYCHDVGVTIGWILIGDSEVRVITASSLISTIHKSPQHPLNLFQPPVSKPVVPWQRFLTLEILQLHVLRFYPHSLLCRTLVHWTHLTGSTNFLQDNSSVGPHRKHPHFHCCSPTVAAA
jgi:hypothetical protein